MQKHSVADQLILYKSYKNPRHTDIKRKEIENKGKTIRGQLSGVGTCVSVLTLRYSEKLQRCKLQGCSVKISSRSRNSTVNKHFCRSLKSGQPLYNVCSPGLLSGWFISISAHCFGRSRFFRILKAKNVFSVKNELTCRSQWIWGQLLQDGQDAVFTVVSKPHRCMRTKVFKDKVLVNFR